MKRILKFALLLCAFAALLCVCAYAVDGAGMYDVTPVDTAERSAFLTPLDADGTAVTKAAAPPEGISTDFYEGAVQLKVQVLLENAENLPQYYLILAQDSEETKEETIRYIDQESLAGEAPNDLHVEFTVYPDKLESGKTYYIYLAGNGGAKEEVGSFKYYVPYTLGDVNDNGDINTYDASLILQYCVASNADKNTVIPVDLHPAADVNVNGDINTYDASLILQYCVASAGDKIGFFERNRG